MRAGECVRVSASYTSCLPRTKIRYKFAVSGAVDGLDIRYGVTCVAMNSTETADPVLKSTTVSNAEGVVSPCSVDGMLVLYFDNTYSLVRTKQVRLWLTCVESRVETVNRESPTPNETELADKVDFPRHEKEAVRPVPAFLLSR